MKALLPLSLLTLVTGSMNAAVLITPASLTNSSGVSEFFPAANLINDSGLSGAATIDNYSTITHANAGAGNAWTTDAPGGGTADYFALGEAVAPTPVFTLGFDQSYTFTDLVFWGYHFGAANGNEVNAFTLEFSNDNGATFSSSTSVSQPLDAHAVSSAVTLPLGGAFTADTVRVSFTDNHFGGSAAGGDRGGLGEIKFIGDTIPEPSSALLAGLGSLALLRRRR